jgi:hypothetical protein
MSNAKFTQGNMFPNEMYVNLNVFRPPMVHRVAGHVDGQDIITEGHRSIVDRQWSSPKSCQSQVHSAAALATARYNASALERDTVGWHLLDQDTNDSTKKTQ